MAKPTFILQGIRKDNDHESLLKALIASDDFSEIIISVAFVRESGILSIAELLKKYASKITVYAGIRNGNTSAQGLLALLNCNVKLFVVDTGTTSPIFHPKVYLGLSDSAACAIVGSANLTYSGLNQNIEGSTVLNLNRGDEQDEAFLRDFLSAINTLRNNYPDHVLRIMQKRQISSLLNQGRLEDERYAPAPRPTHLRKKIERDNLKRIKLFLKKRTVSIPRKPKKTPIKRLPRATGQLELIWISKGLTERDLNIPSGKNTAKTGSMLLKKGQMEGIDHRTFFREVVFSDVEWARDKRLGKTHYERSEAEFELIVKGVSYGTFKLKLSHDTRKDSPTYKQNNAVTQLHWGEAKNIIEQRDLLDRELRLYRKTDKGDEFVIEID